MEDTPHVLMAQTDDDLKVFAQIRAMDEGDLKDALLSAYMKNLPGSSHSSSSSKKPNFVEASYERIQRRISNNITKLVDSLWGR